MTCGQRGTRMLCLICLECTSQDMDSDSQSNKIVNTITPKFIGFCKTFLQTEVSGGGQLLLKGFNLKKGPRRRLYFCRDCEVLVRNVLRLHSDLNVIKARLLWKVNELRKVIKSSQSNCGGGRPLSTGDSNDNKTHNFEYLMRDRMWTEEVEKLREDLVNKCTEKCRRIFPFVILNKKVNKCGNGKDNNVFVPPPPKSHLNFMISFILVLALKRNWNLPQIASLQANQTTHSESNTDSFLPIEVECSDSDSPSEDYSNSENDRARPQPSAAPKKEKRVNEVKTGKNFIESFVSFVSKIQEQVSRAHENIPDESEPNDTFQHDDEGDRNSDISMDFGETNFSEVEDGNSPAQLPHPSQEDVEQLLPKSNGEATVTLKRKPGRPKKEVSPRIDCVLPAHPPSNSGEEFVPDVVSDGGRSYELRKRSATKISQEEPDVSGDDDYEGVPDQDTYRPPPPPRRPRLPRPRYVQEQHRKRKLQTRGLGTQKLKWVGPPSSFEWKCKICNKCFPVRLALESHRQKSGHFARVYNSRCVVCGVQFSRTFVLFNHLVYKHNGGPDKLQLICKTCNLKTRTVTELQQHLSETHENPDDKSHFCPNCYKSYTTSQCLELHRRLEHFKLPPLFCDDNDCSSKSFFFVDDLNSHMREDPSHQDREMFHCDICNRGFFSSFHRRFHQLEHLVRSEEGMLQCPDVTCTCEFRYKPVVRLHYTSVHVPFQHRANLLTCNKGHRFMTVSKGELDFHMKMSHKDDKESDDNNCDVCDMRFSCQSNKMRHTETMGHLQRAIKVEDEKLSNKDQQGGEEGEPNTTSASEPLVNCAFCEEKFTSKIKLHLHRKLAHPMSKRELAHGQKSDLICELCAKPYPDKHKLRTHMQSHGGPQLQCHHCSKLFTRDAALKLHINRTHTKAEMVICEVCGKACAKGAAYNYHKSEHLLLHSCHLCPKKFSRASSLRGHLRVHTGEKLQCKWCPATYAVLESMKSHVKVAHPEEYQLHYGTTDRRTKLRFKIVQPSGDEGDA